MIYHNKHAIGAVTSFQSSCSVVRGPGRSRNVGELVRRWWSRLSEKSLVDRELWLHSHQRHASLKILELWAHPIPLDSRLHQFGLSFCPLETIPCERLAGRLAQLDKVLCPTSGRCSHTPGLSFLRPVVFGLSKVSGKETEEGTMGFTGLGRTTARDWDWHQIILGECSGVHQPAGGCWPLSS